MQRLILAIFILLTLLGGCGQPKPVSGNSNYGQLGVQIWASRNCVNSGEQVKLRGTVTNEGDRLQIIELQDTPVFDLEIRYLDPFKSPSQENLQKWSEGKSLSQLNRLELKPKETKIMEMDWIAPKVGGSGNVSLQTVLNYKERPTQSAVAFVAIAVDAC